MCYAENEKHESAFLEIRTQNTKVRKPHPCSPLFNVGVTTFELPATMFKIQSYVLLTC